jgi:hypothetical protein
MEVAFLLVENCANIFKKDDDGIRAIDCGTIGPQVLQHAKDLRWASVRPVPLLCKAFSTGNPTLNNITPISIRSSNKYKPLNSFPPFSSILTSQNISQPSSCVLRLSSAIHPFLYQVPNRMPLIGGSKSGSLLLLLRAVVVVVVGVKIRLASREGEGARLARSS